MPPHLWSHLIRETGHDNDPETQHSHRKRWSPGTENLCSPKVRRWQWREGWEVVFQGKLSVRGLRTARLVPVGRARHSWWPARSQNSAISKSMLGAFYCAATFSDHPTEALLPHLIFFSFSARSHPRSFKDSQRTSSFWSWCQRKGAGLLTAGWHRPARLVVGVWPGKVQTDSVVVTGVHTQGLSGAARCSEIQAWFHEHVPGTFL